MIPSSQSMLNKNVYTAMSSATAIKKLESSQPIMTQKASTGGQYAPMTFSGHS